ncbi:MAG: CFI-box-CTERM domain-containing protein [Candidatus Brocadiia bacterium]
MRRAAVCFLLLILLSSPLWGVAEILGPDLSASGLRSNITSQYYVLTSATPNQMNIFDWWGATPDEGGFDSGINSAQPVPANQTFLSASMPLGFNFPVLGDVFSDVQVSMHGWISFGTNLATHSAFSAAPTNDLIDRHPQRYVVAPYWTALNQTLQYGGVYCRYALIDDVKAFIVQWHDLQVVAGDLDTSVFFQCILFEDGRVRCMYWSMGSRCDGGNGVVGIRMDDKYIEYSRFAPKIHDGLAIEFTPSLTPPPTVKKTNAVPYPMPVFPQSHEDMPVAQFFVEPRLNEGTISTIGVRVTGPQNTAEPPQHIALYIVRDVDENGRFDPSDPIVSGLTVGGGPFLWEPWMVGDTTNIQLTNSPVTPDEDNAVRHAEGRKYYLIVASWQNLIMGDSYTFDIVSMTSPDLGISPEYSILVLAGKIKVELADFPMAYGPNFNPPLSAFEIEPDSQNIVVLSFTVRSAPGFSSRLRSFMVQRTGDAPGEYIGLRFYRDKGVRGVFQTGIDEEVTSYAIDGTTTPVDGYTLGGGMYSGVIEIPLLGPSSGSGSGLPNYIPANGVDADFIAVCDFNCPADTDSKTFQLQLIAMTYTGDAAGLVNLTSWGVSGSRISLMLARSVLRIDYAPAWDPDPTEYFSAGASSVPIALIAAYPSSRSGRITGMKVALSGSGYDQTEISNVYVVLDLDANGWYDSADWLLWSGKPSVDNEVMDVTLTSAYGAFQPWQGGTQADFAALNRFIVLVDFLPTVRAGAEFRATVTSLSFTVSSGSPVVMSMFWGGPLWRAVAALNPHFSQLNSESDSMKVRALAGASIPVAAYRFYSGSATTKLNAIAISMPAPAWTAMSALTAYVDANHDSYAQAQEVLYNWARTGGPLAATGTYIVPIGSVEVQAGATLEILLNATFASVPTGGAEFAVTLEKVYFCAVGASGEVALSPYSTSHPGLGVTIISSVSGGGSASYGKADALSIGAPRFVTGGRSAMVLSACLVGPVETVKVERLAYSYDGGVGVRGPEVTLLRVVSDNGDGIYDSGSDAVLGGRFEYDEPFHKFYFYPDEFYLFPGSYSYFMLDAFFASDITQGAYLRIDMDPAACTVSGITYDNYGNPVKRTGGTAAVVYGKKIQGATVYFGTPTGGGQDGGDEGGVPTTGGGGGGGGCFIASSAFGSMAAVAVADLCATRDLLLSASSSGAAAVSLYYSISPAIAPGISARPILRALLRTLFI